VNRHAQVLNPFGQPISRLYASGNNAGVGGPGASYGGGGGTIGPALTFAYIAGRHVSGLGDWD
jgi:predicted oxidoreductase